MILSILFPKIYSAIIIIICVSIVNTEQTEDFCKSFIENGMKIDFMIKYWDTKSYIGIKNDFWELLEKDNQSNGVLAFALNGRITSNWLENKYSLAFTLKDIQSNKLFGFQRLTSDIADLIKYTPNTTLDSDLVVFNSSSIQLEVDFNPSVVFSADPTNNQMICFVKQWFESGEYKREFQYFLLKSDFTFEETKTVRQNLTSFAQSIASDMELVGLLGPFYNQLYYNTVFRVDNRLKYCIYSNKCDLNASIELVDCTQYAKPTTASPSASAITDDTETHPTNDIEITTVEPKSNSLFIVLVVIFVVIVAIICIGLIIFFIFVYKNKPKEVKVSLVNPNSNAKQKPEVVPKDKKLTDFLQRFSDKQNRIENKSPENIAKSPSVETMGFKPHSQAIDMNKPIPIDD